MRFTQTFPERILEQKQQEEHLFCVRLEDGTEVLVKPIPYSIFTRFRNLQESGVLTQAEIENAVFRSYVMDEKLQALYPDQLNAGIVEAVAQQIFAISGPQSVEETQGLVNYYTAYEQMDPYGFLCRTICGAFPTLNPLELDKLSWIAVLRLFAQAQLLLMERGILEKPIDLLSMAREAEKLKAQSQPKPEKDLAYGIFGSQKPPVSQSDPRLDSEPPAPPPPRGSHLPPEVRRMQQEKINRARERIEEAKRLQSPPPKKRSQKMPVLSGRPKGELAKIEAARPKTELEKEKEARKALPKAAYDFPGLNMNADNAAVSDSAGNWGLVDGPANEEQLKKELRDIALVAHADLFKRAKKPK